MSCQQKCTRRMHLYIGKGPGTRGDQVSCNGGRIGYCRGRGCGGRSPNSYSPHSFATQYDIFQQEAKI